MEALYATSLEINSQPDVPLLLQAIVQRAAGLVGTQMGGLYLIKPDGQTLELVVGHNLPGDYLGVTLHLGEGLAGRVAQAGKPMAVEDYLSWDERAAVYVNAPRRRVLGVPLKVGDTVIGVIDVADDKTAGPFSEDEIRLVSLFAHQAAIALENARLFEEARKTAERLQLVSRRLLEVQEEERRHIARELHDEVGQTLTGLTLLLAMSARQLGDAARDNLSEAQALTRDLLTRVREMSLDLRPAMLDDLGLLPALLWHLERYTAQTHVRVTFQHALPEQRFAPEIETVAYRVVQEALTNVARHAGVSEATVRLWITQDTLGLQVKDRGTGFDPEAQLANVRAGGLSGMRERVALLGGQLTIESSPGAGACLTVELPLHQLRDFARQASEVS
jgi:signal transduction histidine kinase